MKEKRRKMLEFGWLVNDALWAIKPRNEKIVNELKELIKNKTELGFTKDEFINELVLSTKLFSIRPIEKYNVIDNFIFSFCKEVYDAVIFKSNNFNLEQRFLDFDLLTDDFYKDIEKIILKQRL